MHTSNTCLAAELRWLRDAPDLICPPAELVLPLSPPSDNELARAAEWADRFQPGFRLGERFETLVQFYLKYASHLTDIKHNIQIHSIAETVGELDFLLPVEGQWFHLEVALKLYLLDGAGSELCHYVGTRRDDCLETKWARILQHQLPLSAHPETHRVLQQMGIDRRPHPTVWIKGWLFYHRGERPAELPALINPNHAHGWWLTHTELALLQRQGTRFLVPTKDEWLLPAHLIDRPVLTFDQLRAQVLPHDKAQLVLILDGHQDDRIECSRGFVVADHWPSIHARS